MIFDKCKQRAQHNVDSLQEQGIVCLCVYVCVRVHAWMCECVSGAAFTCTKVSYFYTASCSYDFWPYTHPLT